MHIIKQITIFVAVGLMAVCGTAKGDYLLFTNKAPEGASWFTPGNWLFHIPVSTGHTPVITNSAYISSETGPVTAIVDGPGAVAGGLLLGWATGHQANLILPPEGELYVQGACYVGNQSPSTLVITGGVFSGLSGMYIGHFPRKGTPCEVEVLHYAGSVLMTNGTTSIMMNKDPGTNGISGTANYAPGYPRYKLMGGKLQCAYLNIGGKGYSKFEVEGGTNQVGVHIRVGQDVGGDGVYLQSGGLSSCYWMLLGFPGAQGHGELSGGTFTPSTFFCGNGGNGTFVQSGGTNNPGTTYIGGPATGTGIYKISGGKLASGAITVSTNGTFEITGSNSVISCTTYKQTAQATLDLRLTNGVVSPIALTWGQLTSLDGTLNVTLQGSPESYPSRSSVVTVMTGAGNGGYSGGFNTVNLAPANKLISVRVNYNAKTLTLDQWKYAPNGSLLTIR